MAHAHAALMQPPAAAEPGSGVYNEKLGMWIFLGSEVMFFTALIGSYIILRFSTPHPWAPPGVILNIPITAFNTFLLICSSVFMVKAYAAIADGKKHFLRADPSVPHDWRLWRWVDGGLKFWFLMTILGGATFVSIQVYEYIHLAHNGFLPSGIEEGTHFGELVAQGVVPAATAGIYGSTFYTMTGFHGFHVTCGVVSMLYLFFKKVLPEKYSEHDYRGVETIGLYWHFVDLVWIILFTIVYLI